jgi:DNA-directed RNA polymerase specialized sigma24 family protein
MNDDFPNWLVALKDNDPAAAQKLWESYYKKLLRLSGRLIGALPKRVADEEDLALSAMKSFVMGAQKGRFPRLDDETDLWRILVTITSRKVSAHRRRHFAARRNHGAVRGESVFPQGDDKGPGGIGAMAGQEPTPDFAAAVTEECRLLFEKLDDPLLREIATWKMEGYSNEEIAEKLGRTVRTVERKLGLIRDCWSAR